MSSNVDTYVVAFAIFLLIALYTRRQRLRNQYPLPPGPKGLPIIGNILDMPQDQKTWLVFAKWGEIYGNISSITILGRRLVIVNSASVATEMLAGKSSIYSDRPRLVMASELSGDRSLAQQGYDDRWRTIRRLTQKAIGTHAAQKKYTLGKEASARRFVRNVIESPEKLLEHIRLATATTILRDTYGYDVDHNSTSIDPFIAVAEKGMEGFSKASDPSGYLVDFFPALRFLPSWLPGMAFKRMAKEFKKAADQMADVPFQWTKTQMESGTAHPSFVGTLIEDLPQSEQDDDVIKWTASSISSGASDTTVASLYAFFLAITLHPEVAKKAQAELDATLGPEKLPRFEDRPQLPYLNALVMEILRWHNVVPSPPHYSTQDDIHDGYFIPAGSIIFPNSWKMMHDPAVYADPFTFNPERFLGEKPEPDPRKVCFGFGRRICPGANFAEESIFITCATALSVLDVEKAVDSNTGKAIEPVHEHLPGMLSHPAPYECRVKPRNERVKDLVYASG